MKKVAVIIPLYKAQMSETERISYEQCLRILGKHDIVIVTHDSCSLNEYSNIAKGYGTTIRAIYFDAEFFSSVNGYNRLMLSRDFYDRFTEYEYILIYQLDALVFSDQLEWWCDQQYDYIGAPIHFRDEDGNVTKKVWGVGNGGLSLRRVKYCQELLSWYKFLPFMGLRGLARRYKMKWHTYLGLILRLFGQKNTLGYFLRKEINEDLVFGVYASFSYFPARIPDIDVARKFSVESFPSEFYPIKERKMPFGCHAFDKNEYNGYWRLILHQLGVI